MFPLGNTNNYIKSGYPGLYFVKVDRKWQVNGEYLNSIYKITINKKMSLIFIRISFIIYFNTLNR